MTGAVTDDNGEYPISTEIDETHHGYLYYHEGKPVGFCVLEQCQDKCVGCEIYVLPSHRKLGIAKKLCFEVFDLYPYEWHLLQLQNAPKAHAFNLSIAKEYSNGSLVEDEIVDPKWGRVFRQIINSRSMKK